ncbi:MAG: polyprenyl synthetase family protein [Bacteroidales bacterium]|nr:polyprenyl synthetase family protein [Bacteroidales bacterium]
MYTQEELDKIVDNAINNLSIDKEPHNLYQPIEYILSIGGKRIRPKLCLTVFNLFDKEIDRRVINAALSLEVFHNFTLIHDDIMDRADTRRKMPTVHKKWNDNIAILSGDTMNVLAFKYLSSFDGVNDKEIFSLFTDTAAGVCEGQQFDMDYENLPFISMDEYLNMIGLKTAILIACSAKMGALMAGAPIQVCDAIYQYGYELGIAFQITDDYLDTYGDSSVFGKKIGNDIATNKKTWLLTKCMQLVDDKQRSALNSLLDLKDDYSEQKFAGVLEIYNSLEIKYKAIEQIEYYESRAMEAVAHCGLDDRQLEILANFAKMLTYRNS